MASNEDAGILTSERGYTGSLDLGIQLLRVLAGRDVDSWSVGELSAACGVDDGLARRMLDCLLDARMAKELAVGRYGPGPLLFELSLALPERSRFQRRAEELLKACAERMGAVALLMLRSGADVVCCAREGFVPFLPPLNVAPGTRAPLFASVGGIAILQRLPAGEAQALVQENTVREVAKRGTGRLRALRQMREESGQHGFGVNTGNIVPGVHSLGVAVDGTEHGPFAAVCLVGTPERFPLDGLALARDELDRVAALLASEACRQSIQR